MTAEAANKSEQKMFIPSWGYRLFKAYVKWGERLFFGHIYLEGDTLIRQYKPEDGTMVMTVSNHNNTATDAIAAVLRFPNRCKVYSVARADAFAVSPILERVFYWIGMTPAYRTAFGVAEDQVKRNYELFEFTSDQMVAGCPLVLFPEGIHHEEHYLNEWFVNYCRIAFMAAEKTGFEREVQIVPSCNNYTSYFGYLTDVMIRYGEPVSLCPYYELYKSKPRTAQREVNKIVLERVKSLMYNVEDTENYWAIDWLRHSQWGHDWARSKGFDHTILPQMHDASRRLVETLDAVEDRVALQTLYDEAIDLRDEEQRLGIDELCLERNIPVVQVEMNVIWLLVSLPVWAIASIPALILYFVPRHFAAFDKMYTNSIIFIANMLLLLPLMALLMVLVPGLCWGWWIPALLWVLLQPLCWRFAWRQGQLLIRTCADIKRLWHRREVANLEVRRQRLFVALSDLLNVQR